MTAALILFLAQTCVAEIGFVRPATECQLMIEINARNARASGVSVENYTRRFNAYWRSTVQRRARPWIVELDADGTKPPSWPKDARWSRYRPAWLAYLRTVKAVLGRYNSGTYKPLCRRANDYGGRCDDPRGACDVPRGRCVGPVLCLRGRTRQAYWDRYACRRGF